MPDTLDYYKKNTDSMMFAKYQYVLKSYVDADGNVLETDNSDAEKFDMTSLLRRSDDLTRRCLSTEWKQTVHT